MTENRVLVGVDGSPGSDRALAWARTFASRVGGEIVGIHVLTYSYEFMRDLPPAGFASWREGLEVQLTGPWTAELHDDVVPHRCRVMEHDSVDGGLLEAAEAEDVEMIILGAHGHGDLADRLLGSVTYRVSHRARRPVVIVPVDWHPATPH